MTNPLPDNAKSVFKGEIFEVFQWPQTMYDGSQTTFEKIKRADTSVIIPVVGDKIILVKEQQPDRLIPYLSLPGGRVNQDEDPLVAAKRELKEETGYESNDWIDWRRDKPSNKIIWTVHTFIARDCHKVTEPQIDSGEKIEVQLLTFDELLMLSENEAYRGGELVSFFYHLRLHPEEKEEFNQLLFGKSQ
jgi:ADP-ribose pyrophosphatase